MSTARTRLYPVWPASHRGTQRGRDMSFITVRRFGAAALVASLSLGGIALGMGTAGAVACTPVATSRGNFTAAVVNLPVTGNLDATGCDIAAYYNVGTSTVSSADVHGSLWYGVFNDGADVTISNSHIHDIGDTPQNGVQRGVGI